MNPYIYMYYNYLYRAIDSLISVFHVKPPIRLSHHYCICYWYFLNFNTTSTRSFIVIIIFLGQRYGFYVFVHGNSYCISNSFPTLLTFEILMLLLEHTTHLFLPPCNIQFIYNILYTICCI